MGRFTACFYHLFLLTIVLCGSIFLLTTQEVNAASVFKTSDEAIQLGVITVPTDVLQIQMTYSSGAFTIDKANLQKGYAPKQNEFAKEYALVGKDANGRKLYKKFFVVPLSVGAPPPLPGQTLSSGKALSTVKVSEVIPWNTQYKTIEVQNATGHVLASLDNSKIEQKNNTVSFGVKKGTELSPKGSEVQNGTNVMGASTGTLNITFIGHGYTSSDTTLFHDDVIRFAQKLATFSPFTQYLDHIVFYYVNSTTSLGCTYTGTLITCDSALAESIVQASGAPHDRIIILVKNATYGGGEGVIPVVFNGTDGPALFVHEFGHSLSELSDEYIKNDAAQRTDRNCYPGTPPNPAWSGIVNAGDYNPGCNFSSYYRSSPDSIMRNVNTWYFNPASQSYLKTSLDYYAGFATSPTASNAASPTLTALPGDANGDGKVDGIDFVAWLSHYNQTTSNGASWGDFNRDGKVDGIDFVVWLNNYR